MGQITNSLYCLTKQQMTFTTDSFPIMILHKLDRCGNRQCGGRIFRACPLQDINEARTRCRLGCGMGSPTDDQRFYKLLSLPSYKQECGTLRRKHPFMTVTKDNVCAQLLEIQRHLSRRMGCVDDGQDARLSCAVADFFYRQAKRCRRGDVAEINCLCS